MAKLEEWQATLEQWLAQLRQGDPDDTLTGQVAWQMKNNGGNGIHRLLDDLAPEDDEVQVETWLQASLQDDASTSPPYPTLALAFLPAANDWVYQVKTALDQGTLWIYDQVGALCFGFSQMIESTQAPAWTTKSLANNQPIFRYELHPSIELTWEVEVTSFSASEETLRIEVAILKSDEPNIDLADVAVTVVIGDVSLTAGTDAGGVVEFDGIPKAKSAEILVRVAVN